MKSKSRIAAVVAVVSLSASADVSRISEPITVDGRFDEPCWAQAKWEGDFSKFENVVVGREVKAKTEFAMVADARTVYLGVKCHEPDMPGLRARPSASLWSGNTVEFFLAPSGGTFDYYHFAVGYTENSGIYSDFASEGGSIHPDPYKPEWKAARGEFEGGWTLEIALPLAALYMDRNSGWSEEWVVNVSRQRAGAEGWERTSWSRLYGGFIEPKRFRKLKGFPKRTAADDVAMTDLNAVITGRKGDRLVGTASMKIFVAEAGDYEISSPNLETTVLKLKAGNNQVKVGCVFSENGRHQVALALKRVKTGETYRREHPVPIDFQEIAVKLTVPQYRDNFYPGQDSSRIEGTVACALEGEVEIAAVDAEGRESAGWKTRAPNDGALRHFSFAIPADAKFPITITVSCAGRKYTKTVRKIEPNGHRMAWIENGRLIVDGKPTLRRGIYAWGYMGGEAFKEKIDADPALYLTREVCSGGTLEPGRTIKGLERKEAIRDVVPCKEYFEKIDRKVRESRDRDFVYWYISDEPECRGVSPIYLRHIYEHMKEIDPYHPILTASRAGIKYIDCADWFETHPYLNPHDDGNGHRRYAKDPAEMGAFLDAFRPEEHPDKAVGFLPTLFSYKDSLLNDYPTFDEYICHTWAAMIHGGKSLFPYAYHDMGDRAGLYEGNRYVFSSFAALEDLVLNAKRTWLVKNDRVKCVRYDLGAESMFVVVNLTQEPQAAAVSGLEGSYREFRGSRTFTSTSTFHLRPLEVVIGTTKPHDEGLATYAEAKALVERLEAERRGRDNQLLERYREVTLSASKPIGECVKLFDGTRDVIAFYQDYCKDTYVEIAFSKAARSFHVVRVFGRWEGGDPVVSIRKDGDWVELKPEKVLERTKDSIVYDFGRCVRTVKMRISFRAAKGRNHVELYEIELGRDGEAKTVVSAGASVKPEHPLWLLDERNAVAAEKRGSAWLGKPSAVSPREGGGFVLREHLANTGVKVVPEAKWFTVRLEKFSGDRPGYRGWSIYMDNRKHYLCGGVTHPQPGLYTIPVKPVEKARSMQFTWYDYNLDLEFAYAALEAEPADYALCELVGGGDKVEKGDTLEFTVNLRDPAEELSAVLMSDRGTGSGQQPYAVNGSNAVVLKRADDSGRRWTGRMEVKSFAPTKHKVYVKVTALGGSLDLPLFTTTPSFKP